MHQFFFIFDITVITSVDFHSTITCICNLTHPLAHLRYATKNVLNLPGPSNLSYVTGYWWLLLIFLFKNFNLTLCLKPWAANYGHVGGSQTTSSVNQGLLIRKTSMRILVVYNNLVQYLKLKVTWTAIVIPWMSEFMSSL